MSNGSPWCSATRAAGPGGSARWTSRSARPGSGWWTTCVARSTPTGGRWRSRRARSPTRWRPPPTWSRARRPRSRWRWSAGVGEFVTGAVERDGGRALGPDRPRGLVRDGRGGGDPFGAWGSRPVPSWPNASGSRASVWRHRRYGWAERSPSRCRPRTSTRAWAWMSVSTRSWSRVATRSTAGMLAGRIRVALWGEGFATSVDAAPQRHADAVRVRIDASVTRRPASAISQTCPSGGGAGPPGRPGAPGVSAGGGSAGPSAVRGGAAGSRSARAAAARGSGGPRRAPAPRPGRRRRATRPAAPR